MTWGGGFLNFWQNQISLSDKKNKQQLKEFVSILVIKRSNIPLHNIDIYIKYTYKLCIRYYICNVNYRYHVWINKKWNKLQKRGMKFHNSKSKKSTHSRKRLALRIRFTVIEWPSWSTLTIQCTTTFDPQVINILKDNPMICELGWIIRSYNHPLNQKSCDPFAWPNKNNWTKLVTSSSWHRNKTVSIPVACISPCFKKCLQINKEKRWLKNYKHIFIALHEQISILLTWVLSVFPSETAPYLRTSKNLPGVTPLASNMHSSSMKISKAMISESNVFEAICFYYRITVNISLYNCVTYMNDQKVC